VVAHVILPVFAHGLRGERAAHACMCAEVCAFDLHTKP
jgi:hypothetical protein